MVTWGMECLLRKGNPGGRAAGSWVGPPHGPRSEPIAGHPGTGNDRVCEFTGDVRRRRPAGWPTGARILNDWPKPTQALDNPGMKITLKTPEDIQKMRVSGALAAEVLQVVAPHVKAGVSTAELDRICHDHIVNVQKAIPANVGYKGFPA